MLEEPGYLVNVARTLGVALELTSHPCVEATRAAIRAEESGLRGSVGCQPSE